MKSRAGVVAVGWLWYEEFEGEMGAALRSGSQLMEVRGAKGITERGWIPDDDESSRERVVLESSRGWLRKGRRRRLNLIRESRSNLSSRCGFFHLRHLLFFVFFCSPLSFRAFVEAGSVWLEALSLSRPALGLLDMTATNSPAGLPFPVSAGHSPRRPPHHGKHSGKPTAPEPAPSAESASNMADIFRPSQLQATSPSSSSSNAPGRPTSPSSSSPQSLPSPSSSTFASGSATTSFEDPTTASRHASRSRSAPLCSPRTPPCDISSW